MCGLVGMVAERDVAADIYDALTMLRVALNAQNVPPRVSSAFSRLFRDGVRPNFRRDETERLALRQKMLESLQPVIVKVE